MRQQPTPDRAHFLTGKQPGVNVDRIDVSAGLRRLQQLGWDPEVDSRTFMVVEYALQRWARGEEVEAQRGVIAQGETDPEFKSAAIDLTSWFVVLASARAAGEATQPSADEVALVGRPLPPETASEDPQDLRAADLDRREWWIDLGEVHILRSDLDGWRRAQAQANRFNPKHPDHHRK